MRSSFFRNFLFASFSSRAALCLLLLAQLAQPSFAQNQFCAVLRLRNAQQLEDVETLSALTSGDFNGDGRPDLAMTRNDAALGVYAVLIRLNNGSGVFSAPTQFAVQAGPLAIAATDVDGNGKTDLVIAHRSGSEFLRVYLGNGDGTFSAGAQISITQPQDISSLIAKDLNGDGRPDLLVQSDYVIDGASVSGFVPFVNILLNNGSGGFGSPARVDGKNAIAEDLNGDGAPELIITRGDALRVLEGRGNGTFGAELNQATPLREWQHSVTAGDFNGDGKLDIAATTSPNASPTNGQVIVLLGNGAGDFASRAAFTDLRGSIRFVRALRVGSRTDLVASDATSVTYLQNNGSAQFRRADVVLARGFRDAVATDLNNDGRADFALLDKTVTVLNNNGGGGFVDAPLIYDHTSNFLKVANADLNADGNEDLTAIESANRLTIYRGDSAGRMSRAQQLDIGDVPLDLVLADFNRDGRRDVITLSQGNGVSVHLNNGSSLNAATKFAAGGNPYAMAALDYDNDGNLDLALTYGSNANLGLLRGNGSGGFETVRTVSRAAGNFEIISSDFNGDGRGDLIVTNADNRAVVLQSNGNATFAERGDYGVGTATRKMILGDFNADGRQDVAIGSTAAIAGNSDIVVLFSNGNGTFTASPRVEWGYNHNPLTAADINSDGKLDLVMSNTRDSLLLLPGDGTGRFPFTFDRDGLAFPRSYFALGAAINDLISKDLNKDGYPDFVTAGQGITVLYGACLRTASPVSAVSAARFTAPLAPDSIASAFGSRLATSTGQANTNPLPITLAGTTATLFDSNNTIHQIPLFFVSGGQVNFHVPPRAALGNAEVRVSSGDGSYSVGSVTLTGVAPGIFTGNANGLGVAAGLALRVRANGAQTYESVLQPNGSNQFVPLAIDLGPSTDQVFLILFGTGLRNRGTLPLTATIGGNNAEVLFAGAQGTLVGLDQVNLRIPRALVGRGVVDVVVNIGSSTSNTVQVQIK